MRITPTSFINEYEWGSFKGDADTWMEKYFDGYLYLANWGTHEIQLAIPAGLVPLVTAKKYCSSQVAFSREKSGKLIFTFLSKEEADGEWIEGEGYLSGLLQVRNELAHGDLRVLYLGWLIGVQAGESDETEKEPPVPPNLGVLSGPQENLVDFLRLDRDLLAAAAQNSSRATTTAASREETARWIASLPASEKDEMLIRSWWAPLPKLEWNFNPDSAASKAEAELPPCEDPHSRGVIIRGESHSRKPPASGTPESRP